MMPQKFGRKHLWLFVFEIFTDLFNVPRFFTALFRNCTSSFEHFEDRDEFSLLKLCAQQLAQTPIMKRRNTSMKKRRKSTNSKVFAGTSSIFFSGPPYGKGSVLHAVCALCTKFVHDHTQTA